MKSYTVGNNDNTDNETVFDLKHNCLFETYSDEFVSFRDILARREMQNRPLENPSGARVE